MQLMLLFLLGLLFGLAWSHRLFGSALVSDPKGVLALATWVLYLLLFVVRTFGHLRGRKTMTASILLFGWILVFFFGIRHSFFQPLS